MATNRTLLIELRERLLACGAEVPVGAASFQRERAALLAEVAAALSWHGGLGLGQSARRLAPHVDALTARAQSLQALFNRLGPIEQQLATAALVLERIAAPALRDPAAIPAQLERLGAEVRRLGRQVTTDDDLMVDEGRAVAAGAASARLAEALDLWRAAEEVLTRIRASTRTAALEAALPELGERLGRDGPTPQWRADLTALVDPLHRLAQREQPRAITETEKIIKALPRWARALGEDGDAGAALAERFKARRKDWPGEDDRTFQELFEQARALEQGLEDRAAVRRADAIADLTARCVLFSQLVGPDPALDALVHDVAAETPETPRDHEDWCDQLRDAEAAFQNRVKRSENALLATFSDALGDCRQRLEALALIPRLDEKDSQLIRLREHFDDLTRAGQGFEALTLLTQVARARALRGDLDALEAAIRRDQAGLEDARAALHRRARWLAGRAGELAITLTGPVPDLADPVEQPAVGSLEPARLDLERRAHTMAAAEAEFAQVCGEAITAGNQRLAQALAVLDPERVRASGLDPAPLPPAAVGDLSRIAEDLECSRARLAALDGLLTAEEQVLSERAAQLEQTLAALPPEGLGHHDRGERAALLRQFAQWQPDALPDPVERLAVLAELIENAEHSERRVAAAARRLHERRAALRERLRRFNGFFLQGYCPDLYVRVEALIHPPEPARWPRGAEAAQLQEAERLLHLLERQSQRLAARELGETVQTLEQHARRTKDAESSALVAAVVALPQEQQPPARLRRRLADHVLALGLLRSPDDLEGVG